MKEKSDWQTTATVNELEASASSAPATIRRRDFLKSVAGGAAALAAIGPVSGDAQETEAAAKPIRVAHVCLELDGAWGFMKEALAQPGVQLVAVVEGHAELQQKFRDSRIPGTEKTVLYDNLDKMLETAKPQIVIATAPNNEHLRITEACARHGTHVCFQKPMSVTGADARRMQAAAEKAGIQIMISNWVFWGATFQEVFRQARGGAVGKVQKMFVKFGHHGHKDHGCSKWYMDYFFTPERHGGGVLMDQGTYSVHACVLVMGQPKRVWAVGHNLNPDNPPPSEDDVTVVMDYGEGSAVAQGSLAWPVLGKAEMEIYGQKGTLRLADGKLWFRPFERTKQVPEQLVDIPQIPADRRAGFAHFLDCLAHKKPIDEVHAMPMNILIQEVVDAAYESIRSGRAVSLAG